MLAANFTKRTGSKRQEKQSRKQADDSEWSQNHSRIDGRDYKSQKVKNQNMTHIKHTSPTFLFPQNQNRISAQGIKQNCSQTQMIPSKSTKPENNSASMIGFYKAICHPLSFLGIGMKNKHVSHNVLICGAFWPLGEGCTHKLWMTKHSSWASHLHRISSFKGLPCFHRRKCQIMAWVMWMCYSTLPQAILPTSNVQSMEKTEQGCMGGGNIPGIGK